MERRGAVGNDQAGGALMGFTLSRAEGLLLDELEPGPYIRVALEALVPPTTIREFYVRQDAEAGDGSVLAPFALVQEALDEAQAMLDADPQELEVGDGIFVDIGAGVYPEHLTIPEGIEVYFRGAGPKLTFVGELALDIDHDWPISGDRYVQFEDMTLRGDFGSSDGTTATSAGARLVFKNATCKTSGDGIYNTGARIMHVCIYNYGGSDTNLVVADETTLFSCDIDCGGDLLLSGVFMDGGELTPRCLYARDCQLGNSNEVTLTGTTAGFLGCTMQIAGITFPVGTGQAYFDAASWLSFVSNGSVITNGSTNGAITGPVNQLLTGPAVSKTIASGVLSISGSRHTVLTQAGDATDDLDSISNGVAGQILILSAEDSSKTVVVKDGTALKLAGDMTLDNLEDRLVLHTDDGTTWYELSRSGSGA